MAYIEFSLTDHTFIAAQQKWREAGKTEAEVSALTSDLLNQTAAKKESSARDAAARGESLPLGKFPKYLRTFLKDQVGLYGHGAKLKYDPDNDTHHATLPQDSFEVYEWLDEDFKKAFMELLATDEAKGFTDSFTLRPMVSDTSGQAEIADLKAHLEGGESKQNKAARQGAGITELPE